MKLILTDMPSWMICGDFDGMGPMKDLGLLIANQVWWSWTEEEGKR